MSSVAGVQVLLSYNGELRTQALYTVMLVLLVSLLFSHTFLVSLAKHVAAQSPLADLGIQGETVSHRWAKVGKVAGSRR